MESDNSRMIDVWDGEVGQRWVDEQARYERMHEAPGCALLAAAELQPGMRVLDVGCGMGARTLDIASVIGRHGRVVGVDVSTPILDVARRRADGRGITHARFLQTDVESAEDLGDGEFDVVLSQFGVMFFANPVAAFSNLRAALQPGGQLVFACWQDLSNQQHLMVPLGAALDHVPIPEFSPDVWSYTSFSLADPEKIRSVLSEAGFEDIEIQPNVAPMYQGADLDDTLQFLRRSEFGQTVFADAGPGATAHGWEAVATALRPYVRDDGVFLDGAAWVVTASRA